MYSLNIAVCCYQVLSCFSSNNELLVNSEGLEYVHTILTERRSVVYNTIVKQGLSVYYRIESLQYIIVIESLHKV